MVPPCRAGAGNATGEGAVRRPFWWGYGVTTYCEVPDDAPNASLALSIHLRITDRFLGEADVFLTLGPRKLDIDRARKASGQSSNPLGQASAPLSRKQRANMPPFRMSAVSPVGRSKRCASDTVPTVPSSNRSVTEYESASRATTSAISFPNFFIAPTTPAGERAAESAARALWSMPSQRHRAAAAATPEGSAWLGAEGGQRVPVPSRSPQPPCTRRIVHEREAARGRHERHAPRCRRMSILWASRARVVTRLTPYAANPTPTACFPSASRAHPRHLVSPARRWPFRWG